MTGSKRVHDADADAQTTVEKADKAEKTSRSAASKRAKSEANFRFSVKVATRNGVASVATDEEFADKVVSATEKDANCVVVLFLFATWSTPCKTILAQFEAVVARMLQREDSEAHTHDSKNTPPSLVTNTTNVDSNKVTSTASEADTHHDKNTVPETTPQAHITFAFYKLDKDAGPKAATGPKVPLYLVYRGGIKVAEVSCQGKGLEKWLGKLELV
ncbi:hypothetical protein BC830DRAFT_1163842 [Chytriomyces sp. MP71]|nr:hypothetical protein BC830DRAFT_1163842 [Chytriomyces sp. MP71]